MALQSGGLRIVDNLTILGMVLPLTPSLNLTDISDRANLIQNLVQGINLHKGVVEGVVHGAQIFSFGYHYIVPPSGTDINPQVRARFPM